MNFEEWFQSQHAHIPLRSAASVLELSAEGATVPFMARYRKEKTGNLDEVAIRAVISAKESWDELIKRQLFILSEIDKQEKLTPTLRDKILATFRLEALEDIYLPYKLKRKTKAAVAREAGLEPLATWIWDLAHATGHKSPADVPAVPETLEAKAAAFLNPEKKISDVAAAIQGAQDILTERLAETLSLREGVRAKLFSKGFVRSKKGEKVKSPSAYENYFTYAESVKSLMDPKTSHRYLALRRGWQEEELIVSIGGAPQDEGFEQTLLDPFIQEAAADRPSPGASVLMKAARLAFKAHVQPAIDGEIHKALKDIADTAAIQVFAENVGNLLLAPPYGPKATLGIDPGLRTGCKTAVIESSGRFNAHDVLYLQSEGERKKSAESLVRLVREHRIQAVAVGNGTAGRETETFARETLKAAGLTDVPVVMVSESGASVYSASEAAREEFPNIDVTIRGAISIARRLQDPLAELVKVDPKSIGVGQYQHDVSPTALKKSLNDVVDSCVNKVGVNLNTASEHLLARVSGIGAGLAKAVVEHRSTQGLFKSREELLAVPRFSKKTYEQAAGFLRIPEAANPLDNTGVHPERYGFLEKLAERLQKQVKDLTGAGVQLIRDSSEFKVEVGEFTFQDIVSELEKPGRDPRDAFVPFAFKEDIHELKDLKPGLKCPGIVTNVTNFGAFVDIGVHQDGLVHISQLADRFVKDPHEVVKPGDRVEVRVLEVNMEKKQISLSMRSAVAPAPAPDTRRSPRAGEGSGRAPSRPQFNQNRPSPGNPRPRDEGQKFQSSRPQPARPVKLDPNNPFHKLAALRDQLKNADPKKR